VSIEVINVVKLARAVFNLCAEMRGVSPTSALSLLGKIDLHTAMCDAVLGMRGREPTGDFQCGEIRRAPNLSIVTRQPTVLCYSSGRFSILNAFDQKLSYLEANLCDSTIYARFKCVRQFDELGFRNKFRCLVKSSAPDVLNPLLHGSQKVDPVFRKGQLDGSTKPHIYRNVMADTTIRPVSRTSSTVL
jgi:hypothetical protein